VKKLFQVSIIQDKTIYAQKTNISYIHYNLEFNAFDINYSIK